MLSLVDNAALQGLSYGCAVLGVMLAFRILRYPDLTPDGSFLLGSTTYAAVLSAGYPSSIALVFAFCMGSLAGVLTSLFHAWIGINRLLSGILTTMIAYSVAFRVLNGRPNVGLIRYPGLFSWFKVFDGLTWSKAFGIHLGQLLVCLIVSSFVAGFLLYLLRTEWGLLLRATGNNSDLVSEIERSPIVFQTQGLAIANGIVALSAAVISDRQGFADINMGTGVIITLVAALIIGEGLIRLFQSETHNLLLMRILSSFLGCFVYYLLYLLILRASIRGWLLVEVKPTDLRMLSALVVIVVVALRARNQESMIPGDDDGDEFF